MSARLAYFTALILSIAASASAAVVTPVASGLSGAIGQALHPVTQQIYFVEYVTGEMERLNPVTGARTVITTGLTLPEDVALFPGQPLAYITTRDGKIWKVATNTNAKSLVASGLGIPSEIVLDPVAFVAYTVDFSGGNLYRVALGGGATTTLVSGLTNPLGLLLTPDFQTAYVAEPSRILEIDLTTLTRRVVVAGLTSAFFMDWADDSQSAIYVVERDPMNRLSRVDLSVTPATRTTIASVPFRPSSVVRSADPNVVYVASDSVISKVVLVAPGAPVITRVGHIPSSSINAAGLANTSPSYFFYVKNAAFGGRPHLMLNFPSIRSFGAAYYRVFVGGVLKQEAWKNYKWNGTSFVPQTVSPGTDGYYSVPPASELWSIPDLGFVLDTMELSNARQVVVVRLYNASKTLLAPSGSVALRVDNNPPKMDIKEVWHDGVKLNACAMVVSGSPNLSLVFTARDPEAHLYNYRLVDRWGSGHSALVTSDQYIGSHDSLPTWAGVESATVNYTLTDTACAHSFVLSGWGNTVNGFHRIQYRFDTEQIAVYLGGATCSATP